MLTKYQRMELKIERVVGLEYDQLNLRLTNNEIDIYQYEEEAQQIEDWARKMYEDLEEKVSA